VPRYGIQRRRLRQAEWFEIEEVLESER